jgi:hypothetical protein
MTQATRIEASREKIEKDLALTRVAYNVPPVVGRGLS